jgi:hypothetical protein
MRGELRAVDLARGEAWEVGARSELGQLAKVVDHAEEKVQQTVGHEVDARAELARKMADRDVVTKDKARFEEDEKKRALLAEEEAAEEAFQSSALRGVGRPSVGSGRNRT